MFGKTFMRRATGVVVAAGGIFAACPAFAFADEGGGISAILPKMDEFIPMLIAFIILWVILAKFGWPLFEGILNKRENTIRSDLKSAEESKIESARLLEERRGQLESAKAQTSQIIVEARQSAEALRTNIEEEARVEARSIIEKANATIEAERKATVEELQQSIADISTAVAERLIGTDLSDEEHRRIIERYVKEAGSLNAG
ncbi:MAG: F0F1 ATP synthase subunit B [Coriobacteriales bacterium]|jgi:F-type H+-transporting ATPase subunit b